MNDFARHENGQAAPGNGAGGLALFAFAVHCLAAPTQVFSRVPGTCGHNYFGLTGLGGWIAALVVAAMAKTPTEARVAEWYCGALTIAFLVHRIGSVVRQWRRQRCHSMYVGDSWLSRMMPWTKPDWARGPGEAVLWFCVGLGTSTLAPALGNFLIVSGTANLFSLLLIQARDERRLERMEDHYREQNHLGEAFRRRLEEAEEPDGAATAR